MRYWFWTLLFCLGVWSDIALAATILVDQEAFSSAQQAGANEAQVDWADAHSKAAVQCTQAFAAAELQHYLRNICGDGNAFADVDDAAEVQGELLLIGGPNTNAATARYGEALGVTPAALAKVGAEGYLIRTGEVDGRRVTIIAGGGRVGTLYGVYDYLHRLGVRWYAPGEGNEEIPHRVLKPLPEINATESPLFLTRGFHAWEDRGDEAFLLWMARNRLNYWCVEQRQKALLHKLGIMLAGGGHVLTEYYLGPHNPYPYNHTVFEGDEDKPVDPYAPSTDYQGDANRDGVLSYFEAHPEWYAWIDGKRSDRIKEDFGDNFCTSNEDAMAEWCKNAVQDLVDGRYKDASLMNAWALDVGKWCTCEKCKALGSSTDRNLLLVYHYDQAIKKAQAQGRINRPIRLLFLAYADVLEPPTRPLPDDFDYDTCIATYFPIERSYVYNFDDPRCSKNTEYKQHLQGWAVDQDRFYRGKLFIGEYYNVSGYKCLPICFMHTMENDIPYYYHKVGARHFNYMHCTTKNWGNKALTNWQMARQLWTPDVNCESLWQDYFSGRYGDAASDMRRFYETLEKMLCNVRELKYVLGRGLRKKSENLFPNTMLRYEKATFEKDDGPDLVEIIDYAAQCRKILQDVLAQELPARIRSRIEEDERLFTYGERTVQFYDALCRGIFAARDGEVEKGYAAYDEACALARLLKKDTISCAYASNHANAGNALDASYAKDAVPYLKHLLRKAKKK